MPIMEICSVCGGTGFREYTETAIKSVISNLEEDITELKNERNEWEDMLKEFSE